MLFCFVTKNDKKTDSAYTFQPPLLVCIRCLVPPFQNQCYLNPLSANPTKWSDTLKQLALKELFFCALSLKKYPIRSGGKLLIAPPGRVFSKTYFPSAERSGEETMATPMEVVQSFLCLTLK